LVKLYLGRQYTPLKIDLGVSKDVAVQSSQLNDKNETLRIYRRLCDNWVERYREATAAPEIPIGTIIKLRAKDNLIDLKVLGLTGTVVGREYYVEEEGYGIGEYGEYYLKSYQSDSEIAVFKKLGFKQIWD